MLVLILCILVKLRVFNISYRSRLTDTLLTPLFKNQYCY